MGSIVLILNMIALLAGNCGQKAGEKGYENINWHHRNKVFYTIWDQEDDKGYHISRTRRMFIIDNQIFIREFPHSDSRVYKIKEIEYQGDSVITAMVDHDLMAFAPYSEILSGQREIDWKEMHNPGASVRKVTLTKEIDRL